MKILFFKTIILIAIAMSSSVLAQDTAHPNAVTSQAITDLLADPDRLFQKLDTNNDGQLSHEEFGQISSSASQNNSISTPGTESAAAIAPTDKANDNAAPPAKK